MIAMIAITAIIAILAITANLENHFNMSPGYIGVPPLARLLVIVHKVSEVWAAAMVVRLPHVIPWRKQRERNARRTAVQSSSW